MPGPLAGVRFALNLLGSSLGKKSNLKIKIDSSQLDRLAKKFKAAGAKWETELKRAVADTERATRTEAKRQIAARYATTQRRISEGLRYSRASTRLGFAIIGMKKPLRVRDYGGRATKSGVSVAIFRGTRKVIRSGFAGARARGSSGGGAEELWIRTGEAPRLITRGSNAGRRKEPIRPLVGPSVANQLDDEPVVDALQKFFESKLSNETRRRLAKLLKPGR
jgi:hypothetical protein